MGSINEKNRGKKTRDTAPLKGECYKIFDPFFFFFMILIHFGPLIICWSIFEYSSNFVEFLEFGQWTCKYFNEIKILWENWGAQVAEIFSLI